MKAHEELHADYIQSTYRREVVRVLIKDISHFKAELKYVVVYHDGGELLLSASTLKLEQAYSEQFIRVHKNSLVARNRLLSFQREHGLSRNPASVRLLGVTEPVAVARGRIKTVRTAVAKTINQQHQAGETA
ncbi:LytTR family DNA-binding domain-containing protein [Pseudomonas ovata]|uniref:LytTR family DNA-binding domain-containing protein n=1 Tax=Pseudomonas ovata TaxID=1839709 RepID=UPI000D69961D|nr:LytTR family DNA-binding domain-containing protein [Pseudomonas ovata]